MEHPLTKLPSAHGHCHSQSWRNSGKCSSDTWTSTAIAWRLFLALPEDVVLFARRTPIPACAFVNLCSPKTANVPSLHRQFFGIAFGLIVLLIHQPNELKAQTVPAGFSDASVIGGWSGPVGAVWDANGRMYVWEKRGRVWIVENGTMLATPMVNIDQEVGNWGDHGFLGFALDPQFLSNGYVYLMYTVDRHHLIHFGTPSYDPYATEGNAATIIRITRYTAIGPSYNTVDVNSRLVLVGETKETGVPVLFNTHGPGTLVFGQDGTLLASVGEGSSAVLMDVGNASESYYVQALADGIIRPEENVGALRAQMVNSLNGKVLRIDPATGNGIASNPFYDAAAPRAPRSRVWAMGFRNPYRMTLKPGSGSTNPALADPGTLFIGDVGWSTWEELNVCREGGSNFGWPIFEGLEPQVSYSVALIENKDVPNPLYDGINCTQRYLRFQDLIKQASPNHVNGHPNPCNSNVQIPNSIPTFYHERPAIDWMHGNRSRCGAFNGNNAVTFDLDDVASPVPGPRFGGYAAIGGPWMAGSNFPVEYQNSSFHADYPGGWIKRFMFDGDDEPISVHDFASGLGAVNWLGAGPDGCIWYIKYNTTEFRRICYTLGVNLPPTAVATQNVQYGPGPLSVNFTGSSSTDPENGPLTYTWNFGDGTSNSTVANPTHVFNAPAGVPTMYTVTLTVRDNQNQPNSKQLIVSVNNTPPNVAITSFQNGAYYPVGMDTTFQLQAAVSDAQHGPAQLSYAWVTSLHHNTHVHPGPEDANVASSTVISGEGCDGNDYSYGVSLTVTDAAGLSTTVQHILLPRCHAIAPVAVITASIDAGPSPLSVDLSGLSSFDPGTIVSYQWDFSDGTFSTSPTPTKVFTASGDHQVVLRVTDNDGLTGTAVRVISVLTYDPPQCVGPAGDVLREYWSGIPGWTILDLLNHPNYPNTPTSTSFLTSFQGPTNIANSYGTRVRGYIVAPQNGDYTFTVTSDDASVVYLSPNADPRYKQVICSVLGTTGDTEYGKYPTQVSTPISLRAGRYYYVELLHKEQSSSDHFTLRWQTPSNGTRTVVPGSVLVRWQNCPPSVRVRMNLQGPWDPATNMMVDQLRAAALVPSTEPFTALGFTHAGGGGGETVSASRLAVTGKNAVVDWVLVELRNKLNSAQVLATRSALLERDGDVIGTDGNARILFNVSADNYFVAVRHRNHLGVMTANTVTLNANEVGVDLTRGAIGTWGASAQAVLSDQRSGLWAGNAMRDDALRYLGNQNDRDPILLFIGGSVPTNTAVGYRPEDVNMDGTVKYVGQGNDRDFILQNVGGAVPTTVRFQQLP